MAPQSTCFSRVESVEFTRDGRKNFSHHLRASSIRIQLSCESSKSGQDGVDHVSWDVHVLMTTKGAGCCYRIPEGVRIPLDGFQVRYYSRRIECPALFAFDEELTQLSDTPLRFSMESSPASARDFPNEQLTSATTPTYDLDGGGGLIKGNR